MSSWEINPSSGDFVMEKGAPAASESLTIPAFYRLKIQRGKWLYAPDDQYGSDFYLIKKRFNGGDLSGLRQIAERALQPLIDDKRARSVTVEPDPEQQQKREASFLKISVADAHGKVEDLNLPPLSGA